MKKAVNGRWNSNLMWPFAPLCCCDTHFWYRNDGYESGRHPVNWIEIRATDDDQPLDSPPTAGNDECARP